MISHGVPPPEGWPAASATSRQARPPAFDGNLEEDTSLSQAQPPTSLSMPWSPPCGLSCCTCAARCATDRPCPHFCACASAAMSGWWVVMFLSPGVLLSAGWSGQSVAMRRATAADCHTACRMQMMCCLLWITDWEGELISLISSIGWRCPILCDLCVLLLSSRLLFDRARKSSGLRILCYLFFVSQSSWNKCGG